MYRSVSRHFKALVEGEYVRRYLRECAIILDTGLDDGGCAGFDSTGEAIRSQRSLRYDFAGFAGEVDATGHPDNKDRFALFRCQLDDTRETSRIASTQALDQPPQHNYHPNILMHLGTGATDLLPSDLQFISSSNDPANSWTFRFDWRRYFCTLFGEVKHAATFRDECWQKKLKVRPILSLNLNHLHLAACPSLIFPLSDWLSVLFFVTDLSDLQTDLFLADDEKDDPDRGRGRSLVSLATSLYCQAEEKRMMLEHTPLLAATDDLSTAHWPSGIDAHTDSIFSATTYTAASLTSTSRIYSNATTSSVSDDDEDLLSPHARAQLILAAGTYDVGVDGRYREVRRQRRRQIWHRLQQENRGAESRLLRIGEAAQSENEEQRTQRIAFERLGEGRVARKLLMLQAQAAGRRGVIEW